MPSECDDGPFGRGTGGQLRYDVRVPRNGTATLWIAVAGSDDSPAEARREFTRLTTRPARLLARKRAARETLAAARRS